MPRRAIRLIGCHRRAWRLAIRRSDVLVHPENVLRIESILEGDKAVVLAFAIRLTHALLSFVHEEVDVFAVVVGLERVEQVLRPLLFPLADILLGQPHPVDVVCGCAMQ